MCAMGLSLASFDFGREVRLADADISLASDVFASFAIQGFVARLRCAETVDVAVVHAERRCDQYRIVNFQVACALAASVGDVFLRHLLAVLLYFGGDHQQGLQLVRNIRMPKIGFDSLYQILVIVRCAAAIAPWMV